MTTCYKTNKYHSVIAYIYNYRSSLQWHKIIKGRWFLSKHTAEQCNFRTMQIVRCFHYKSVRRLQNCLQKCVPLLCVSLKDCLSLPQCNQHAYTAWSMNDLYVRLTSLWRVCQINLAWLCFDFTGHLLTVFWQEGDNSSHGLCTGSTSQFLRDGEGEGSKYMGVESEGEVKGCMVKGRWRVT